MPGLQAIYTFTPKGEDSMYPRLPRSDSRFACRARCVCRAIVCCAVELALGLPLGFPLEAGAAFRDVPAQSWYAEAVEAMTASGWLTGYRDNTFRPNQPITGAELVTILARRAGLAPAQGQNAHWAAGYLQAALEQGWYDWDELPPTGETYNQPIARQLAVSILMRAVLPEAKGDYQTESRKISDFAALDGRYYNAVLAAYAVGLVTGDQTGAFRPKDSLSRAEASILLQRADAQAKTASSAATAAPTAPATSVIPAAPNAEPAATPAAPATETAPSASQTPLPNGVSAYGWLQVKGAQLCDAQGKPVVLRGMSTHGLQWFGQFASTAAMQATAAYGANLFRLAVYTAEGGYLQQPEAMKKQVIAAIDTAIAQDMYVILDWHILFDGNPMAHRDEAVAFFSEMAERYRNAPAVLYEICNEPNGDVTWERDIKPYAESVIAAIRAQSSQAVILVGSSTWSQDIHQAAQQPLEGSNLMYTCHFYAGTHGAWLRERIDQLWQQGFPVFVSEWGTSSADGSGGVFLEESQAWLDFLNQRGISWANWSLCDKAETSAALQPGANLDGAWSQADLSPSGQFVFSHFRDPYLSN